MADSLKILWLKSGPLYPLDTGGKIRTHAMLTEISKLHHVTYLALKDEKHPLHPEEESAPYATEKSWVPWQESTAGTLRFFLQLLSNLLFSSYPYALAKYQSTALRERIAQLDDSAFFDLIICDFLFPAPNFFPIRSRLLTPTILFQHNIESEIWRRLAETKTNPFSRFYFHLQYRRMFRWEQKLSQLFGGIITVSPNDNDFCRRRYHLQNVLGEVPTGVDIDFFSPRPTASAAIPPHIAFLGSMDWMPNIECVQYFASRVLPLIHNTLPEARLVIIGRNPSPAVCELAKNNPSVELTGTVEDVRPHLQSCALMVVPLRAGGGTRIKIFEAMAMGVPVVSTTIGAEGLPVIHGKDILIADSDQALAEATLQLLKNPGLAQEIATAARQKVERDHCWQAVSEQFLELCNKSR